MLSFVVLAVYFFFATHSLSRPLFIPRCLVSCYFHLKWFQREDPLSSPDYIYPSAGPRGTRACVSRLAKGKRFSRHAKGRRKSTTPNRYIDPYILTRFQQKKWKKGDQMPCRMVGNEFVPYDPFVSSSRTEEQTVCQTAGVTRFRQPPLSVVTRFIWKYSHRHRERCPTSTSESNRSGSWIF